MRCWPAAIEAPAGKRNLNGLSASSVIPNPTRLTAEAPGLYSSMRSPRASTSLMTTDGKPARTTHRRDRVGALETPAEFLPITETKFGPLAKPERVIGVVIAV